MLNKFRNDEGGFTLIELLVVILIIGILAAIALPTFLGQREKAQDSSAKADVRNAVTQMESCLADSSVDATAATTACSTDSTVVANGATVTASGAGTYAVARSSASGTSFTITKAAPGTFTRTCSGSSKGCTGGTW